MEQVGVSFLFFLLGVYDYLVTMKVRLYIINVHLFFQRNIMKTETRNKILSAYAEITFEKVHLRAGVDRPCIAFFLRHRKMGALRQEEIRPQRASRALYEGLSAPPGRERPRLIAVSSRSIYLVATNLEASHSIFAMVSLSLILCRPTISFKYRGKYFLDMLCL